MPDRTETRRTRRSRTADPEAVADRRARAMEEAFDIRIRSREPYPLLEVRNPVHGTGYLVMLPEHPARDSAMCTCTDFARRGLGTCKHIEAGVRWLGEHPDDPPLRHGDGASARALGAWKRIDQRLGALSKDPAAPARRWRRPGAVLFEPGRNE